MKLKLYISLLLFALPYAGQSQDIPIYSQKLTNSFIFNPAVAGSQFGSLTLSHRRFWSGIEDAPSSNLLSFHVPFAYHRFGTGVNVFQENIGIYDRVYASGAFAFHIPFTEETALSMGVSAEYNYLRTNTNRIDVVDVSDEILFGNNLNTSSVDFSFGLNYRTRFFDIGGSANRLSSGFGLSDESNQLSGFFTGYLRGKLPIAGGRDLIEPMVTYRHWSAESNQTDIGLFYTFNNIITVGGGYRSSNQLSATAAIRIMDKFMVGYSYETFNGEFRSALGNSSEITLRIDLNDERVHSRTGYKNSRRISTASLAFRRKSLSRMSSLSRRKANNKRMKKRLKRNYIKSPSYKLNHSKKLHTKKVKRAGRKRQQYKRNKKRRRNNRRR